MASIKLTYLNYKGRAELLRYILAQASVEYEDNRIDPGAWGEAMPGKEVRNLLQHTVCAPRLSQSLGWIKERIWILSAGTEFGTPVLEMDGSVIKSNRDIAKFLAEKYGKSSG
jgi:hypothetical protein